MGGGGQEPEDHESDGHRSQADGNRQSTADPLDQSGRERREDRTGQHHRNGERAGGQCRQSPLLLRVERVDEGRPQKPTMKANPISTEIRST